MTLEMTCGFLMRLVFCTKMCLHHQSVAPFLSGAPPPKKNPGSAPAVVTFCFGGGTAISSYMKQMQHNNYSFLILFLSHTPQL